jgi:hypothetical protein
MEATDQASAENNFCIRGKLLHLFRCSPFSKIGLSSVAKALDSRSIRSATGNEFCRSCDAGPSLAAPVGCCDGATVERSCHYQSAEPGVAIIQDPEAVANRGQMPGGRMTFLDQYVAIFTAPAWG